jgi:hypothetical protein
MECQKRSAVCGVARRGVAIELQPNHSVLVATLEGESATLGNLIIVRRLVTDHPRATVNGSCSPAFDKVCDAFESNFHQRDEVGAAVASGSTANSPSISGAAPLTPRNKDPGERTPSPASSPAQKR